MSWAPNPGRGGEERLVGLNPEGKLRTPPRSVVVVGLPSPSLALGIREATAPPDPVFATKLLEVLIFSFPCKILCTGQWTLGGKFHQNSRKRPKSFCVGGRGTEHFPCDCWLGLRELKS